MLFINFQSICYCFPINTSVIQLHVVKSVLHCDDIWNVRTDKRFIAVIYFVSAIDFKATRIHAIAWNFEGCPFNSLTFSLLGPSYSALTYEYSAAIKTKYRVECILYFETQYVLPYSSQMASGTCIAIFIKNFVRLETIRMQRFHALNLMQSNKCRFLMPYAYLRICHAFRCSVSRFSCISI